jgi:hypothetical protein
MTASVLHVLFALVFASSQYKFHVDFYVTTKGTKQDTVPLLLLCCSLLFLLFLLHPNAFPFLAHHFFLPTILTTVDV